MCGEAFSFDEKDRRVVNDDTGGLAEVNRVSRLLMAEWERVEKPVTPSYVATFADMARVVAADSAARVAAARAEGTLEALDAVAKDLEWLEDDVCGAIMAARQGSYDGRPVLSHLESLLERIRAVGETTQEGSDQSALMTCWRCGHSVTEHFRGFCHHPAGVAMCGCRASVLEVTDG